MYLILNYHLLLSEILYGKINSFLECKVFILLFMRLNLLCSQTVGTVLWIEDEYSIVLGMAGGNSPLYTEVS